MINQDKKIFPLDLDGILLYGLEKWVENNNPNPFCGLYQQIYAKVYESYTGVFCKDPLNQNIYYTALVNYKIIFYLTQYIYNLACLHKIREMGFDYVAGKGPVPIAQHINYIHSKFENDFLSNSVFLINFKEKLKEHWRKIKLNYGHCGVMDSLRPSKYKNNAFLIGDSAQKELRGFINERKIRPLCIRPRLYINLSSAKFAANPNAEKIKESSYLFFRVLESEIVKITGFELILRESLKNKFSDFYLMTSMIILNMAEKLSRWNNGMLLVTHPGNMHHRIFASAWKMLGRETVGFSHGNIYPYAYFPGDIINGALALLDKFVLASKGEKYLIEEALKDFDSPLKGSFEPLSLENSEYKRIYESLSFQSQVKEIKNVVIVGHPMDYYNSPLLPFLNTFSILHLEYRLILCLKNAGYRVFYKYHPDTEEDCSGLFDNLADEISKGRFEDCFGDWDCIIFTKPFSTTFGFTLMTRKPVVLLCDKNIKWYPEVKSLLEKRISIVQSNTNKSGTIEFDTKYFIENVESSKNKTDYSIVEKFAL